MQYLVSRLQCLQPSWSTNSFIVCLRNVLDSNSAYCFSFFSFLSRQECIFNQAPPTHSSAIQIMSSCAVKKHLQWHKNYLLINLDFRPPCVPNLFSPITEDTKPELVQANQSSNCQNIFVSEVRKA